MDRSRALDDLVLLDSIDEANVVALLRSRFLGGEMYTYSGATLIATNPFKLLQRNGKSLYDESVIDAYRGTVTYEMPPHVYAIAEAAYSSMLRYRRDQAIIISGESGAGKTEATKQCLQFISVRAACDGGEARGRGHAA